MGRFTNLFNNTPVSNGRFSNLFVGESKPQLKITPPKPSFLPEFVQGMNKLGQEAYRLSPLGLAESYLGPKQKQSFRDIQKAVAVSMIRGATGLNISEPATDKFPVLKFAGEAVGGAIPYIAAPGANIPKFAGISMAKEIARQATTPEKLNLLQRAGKVGTAGAGGAITGGIFNQTALLPFWPQLLQRSLGTGATAIPETILDRVISGQQPDAMEALKAGGMSAGTMAALSALTAIPGVATKMAREGAVDKLADRLYTNLKESNNFAEIRNSIRERLGVEPTDTNIKGFIKERLVKEGIYERPISDVFKALIRTFKKNIFNERVEAEVVNPNKPMSFTGEAISPEKALVPIPIQSQNALKTPSVGPTLPQASEYKFTGKAVTTQRPTVVFTGKTVPKENIRDFVYEIGNLRDTKKKNREEIFAKYENELKPIGIVNQKTSELLKLSDPNVYTGKAYFLNHHFTNHPDIEPARYYSIPEVLKNPDEIKIDTRDPKKEGYVFVKKYDKFHTIAVNIGKEGNRLVLYKTFFSQSKKPYESLPSIGQINVGEGGVSSIGPATESSSSIAPAATFSARPTIQNIPQENEIVKKFTGKAITPLEIKQEKMQERRVNVEMAKDRLAELNNIRKYFMRRIRKYKQGFLKEELQGLPKTYVTTKGGIASDEAKEELQDKFGVRVADEYALKEYFQELEREVKELRNIIATNKPRFIRRSELTILKQEEKIFIGAQKKSAQEIKKVIDETAMVSRKLEKKAFKAGKELGAEQRKISYFGPVSQVSKQERAQLYLLAKEKGLYYTDYTGGKHDMLKGILKFYRGASFDQFREYISNLTGDTHNPPKLFKLFSDINKDTELIKLLNEVSDKWDDINKAEVHTLDPVRIVEKVTGLGLWEDNILADHTFLVYAAADEAMYDRLVSELNELEIEKQGIRKGGEESAELMRKAEAGEPLTDKEKKAEQFFRQKFDSLLNEMNDMRMRLKKRIIPRRANYWTHIQTQNLLIEYFKGDEKGVQSISPAQLDAIRKGDYTKGNMPFNKFAQRRLGEKTKYDAVGNFETYLKTALKEIYYTPAITYVRKFTEYALTRQPNAWKALDRLANDLKGKPSIQDQNAIGMIASHPVVKYIRSLQAKSALLGNLNFWLMNASNFSTSYGELGNYMNKGMAKFLGAKKWREFAFRHSNMLKGRTIDPDIEPGKLKTIEEVVGYITNLLEYNNVGSVFVGAYFKGGDLGYNQAKAIKYADSIARRTQVGYKKYELNAWMRSNSGMLLSQFQAWTFNAMNHLIYDIKLGNIPRNLLGKFTGKEKRPVRWDAFFTLLGISMLVNYLYKKIGLREPYGPEAAMPRIPGIGGAVPPLFRIGQNVVTTFTGKKPETRQKAAIRAITSFIPMGTQVGRLFAGQILPTEKKSGERFNGDMYKPYRFKSKFKSKFSGGEFKRKF